MKLTSAIPILLRSTLLSLALIVAAATATATAATAQNVQAPQPSPTLVPGLETFSLAGDRPPAPTATPTPMPTPPAIVAPSEMRPAPIQEAAPEATGAPRPRVTSPAVRIATPDAAATTAPPPVAATPVAPGMAGTTITPVPTAAPAGSAGAADIPVDTSAFPTLTIALATLSLLVLGTLAWLFLRRRPEPDTRPDTGPEAIEPGIAPQTPEPPPAIPTPPVATPVPVPTPSPPPSFLRSAPVAHGPRAWIELRLRPLRAGTNLTGAAVDYEIALRNAGAADATDIRLDIRLISGASDQDLILETLFGAPIERPVATPFGLAAGEQVILTGMAMLPYAAIDVFSVRERPLFVPLVALNAEYRWDGGSGQTASSFVVGMERDGGGKMAPFRADTGPRMYDTVGQRAHSFQVTR